MLRSGDGLLGSGGAVTIEAGEGSGTSAGGSVSIDGGLPALASLGGSVIISGSGAVSSDGGHVAVKAVPPLAGAVGHWAFGGESRGAAAELPWLRRRPRASPTLAL